MKMYCSAKWSFILIASIVSLRVEFLQLSKFLYDKQYNGFSRTPDSLGTSSRRP